MSARAHASAAVGLLGQTCCRQPRRGETEPRRVSRRREREREQDGAWAWGGAADRFTLRLQHLHMRDQDALCARAFSARCPRHTSTDLHQVADTFRPATNLLPSLSEAAAMAATLPPSHDTGHPSQIREFEPFHRSPPGRALCTSHSPGLRAAVVLCCLPRTRPHAPRKRGRLHPCLRALPPTPMTSTPARQSCTKISRRSQI